MEADVVEGADSPLVDGAGPCGSKEAETLFIVLRGMLEEETDKKKTKKNSGVDENGEEAIVEKENAEEKRRKWLTDNKHEGKTERVNESHDRSSQLLGMRIPKTADLRH